MSNYIRGKTKIWGRALTLKRFFSKIRLVKESRTEDIYIYSWTKQGFWVHHLLIGVLANLHAASAFITAVLLGLSHVLCFFSFHQYLLQQLNTSLTITFPVIVPYIIIYFNNLFWIFCKIKNLKTDVGYLDIGSVRLEVWSWLSL